MEKEKTAVEWLIEKLDDNLDVKHSWRTKQYIEQAKEMQKEQIMNAYNKGQENPYEYSEDNEVNYYDGNNYYIEKYEKVF